MLHTLISIYLTMYQFALGVAICAILTDRRTWRFLTDKAYATQVMGAWFDRVSDDWCMTAEDVAEGAMHLAYYDHRLSVFAVHHMLAFRARARLTRIHYWLFGVADRLTLHLKLAVEPRFLQRSR